MWSDKKILVPHRFAKWFHYKRGELLNPVATCVKICRICKRTYKTDAHAQKDCDDCKEKIKAKIIKPYRENPVRQQGGGLGENHSRGLHGAYEKIP
jgi:hypothetical protein